MKGQKSVAASVGFRPYAPRDAFSDEEWQALLQHGRAFSDLTSGYRAPRSEADREFVRAMIEGWMPTSDLHLLWMKYLALRHTPLTIELVPSSTWFTNVRSAVSRSVWDALRRSCYEAAGHLCEVCGGRGGRHAVEAHEVFEYDDASGVQRLCRLVALCPRCHEVKHIGLADHRGNTQRALQHLARVNGWTIADASLYREVKFEEWARRSSRPWVVDLSWLHGQGVLPEQIQVARPRGGQERVSGHANGSAQ